MNADRLAPWYKSVEHLAFGRSLERRRLAFLPRVGEVQKALLIGDGDGRFLTAFLRSNRSAEADYMDASREMLRLARRRAQGFLRRVRFHHADVLNCELPEADYDLVTTHFVLDCFAEPDCARLISQVSARTPSGALWLVSEFRLPEHGWRRRWAQFWIAFSYWFFRRTTGLEVRAVPRYAPLLRDHGWVLESQTLSATGLLVSELWRKS